MTKHQSHLKIYKHNIKMNLRAIKGELISVKSIKFKENNENTRGREIESVRTK